MKVNFLKELVELNGEKLMEPKKQGGAPEPITLKELCANALVNSNEGDDTSKIHKYELGLKIIGSKGAIEISAEDIVLIKSCINKFPPIIFSQAVMLLEGKK